MTAGVQAARGPDRVMESAVGLALLLVAVLARGSWRCRALAGASGAAWPAGSVPELALPHQGLLLVLLVSLPSGVPGGWVRRLLIGAAVPVALLLLPQPAVAALFAAASLPGVRTDAAARVFRRARPGTRLPGRRAPRRLPQPWRLPRAARPVHFRRGDVRRSLCVGPPRPGGVAVSGGRR